MIRANVSPWRMRVLMLIFAGALVLLVLRLVQVQILDHQRFEAEARDIHFWTETIISDDDEIAMTWHEFMEPYMLVVPAGSVTGRPHGVYSCFIPSRKAQLTINGDMASGVVTTNRRGDKDSSSACLAWSETWVRP